MRVHDHLRYWARRTPRDTAVTDGKRSVTWEELDAWSDRVGSWFAERLSPGDRVAILSRNCIEYLPLYYGAFKAGVVLVPLNFRLVPSEWCFLIEDSGSKLVVASDEYAGDIDGIRGACGARAFAVIGERHREGWESILEGVAAQQPGGPGVEIPPEAELYQMYTSGTSGRPKGAVLTHAAVNANIQQISMSNGLRQEWALVMMPLFHAGAAVDVFSLLATGNPIYLMHSFDPAEVVRVLAEERIGSTTFVPAMIQAILASVPDAGERKYPNLRLITYGASPIGADLLRQAIGVFHCDFAQVYGMTESAAAVTVLDPEDHVRALEDRPELLLSCGRPVPGTSVRIVDSDGRDVPPGEVGQIVVRGPQLMKGYWNLPLETGDALRAGWLHTGDAGRLDDEGYLYICDRVIDMIVSGGENIYPREIEEVLFAIPGVADAAVIGVPDARWGEAVKAVVVARSDASLTEDLVIEHCKKHLGSYKCPRSVEFVAELPRNATGKVLKRELREVYWKGQQRSVH